MLLAGLGALGLLSYARLWGDDKPPDRPGDRARVPATSTGRAPRGSGQDEAFEGAIFGTTYHVKAYLPLGVSVTQAEQTVSAALARVDASMSTYKTESELSRLSQAEANTWFDVSPELMFVLSLAQRVHAQTQGAFDVTVAPLVRAWGFGAGAEQTPPTEEELLHLRRRVGMQHIHLRLETHRVMKEVPGVELDLSAIAKGYGVDQAAAGLEALGVADYMVEVGGEVRVSGEKAGGSPWKLGIEMPSPEGRALFGVLSLSSGGLATSGDYRNFRAVDGSFVSHTLDPRTGRPVPRRTASVSVVRETAAEADALATALSVLEPEEGLRLANEHGWAVLLILHGPRGAFSTRSSRTWHALDYEPSAAP